MVRHRRHWPQAHAFSYHFFQLWLDLDELEQVFARRWLWSLERRNLASFRRRDFLGDATVPLKDAVRSCIAQSGAAVPSGPIRLLTHIRYAGYLQNPVSFYYCYDEQDALHTIVAEITNTPWGDRHAYVLPLSDAAQHGSAWHFEFDKGFHVSPFLPMARQYSWRFTDPREELRVHMDVAEGTKPQFDATLVLRRQALTGAALARCLWRFPAASAVIVWRIYWNALLIWLKRNPFYAHPQTSAARAKDNPKP